MKLLVRENVIKMLERCVMPHGDGCTQECEYHGRIECCRQVMRNALALLKAQEPVEPTLRGGIGGYWYCGACNYQISRGDKFCRYCGQAVKWK